MSEFCPRCRARCAVLLKVDGPNHEYFCCGCNGSFVVMWPDNSIQKPTGSKLDYNWLN